ncbi:hypothetical protein [Paraflavitalea speifideaquila]|uniref:hypothetical protein n=1 Tax=Paraflavitalea speifideaquila TaxID=3076558 RepID=UPI0028EBF437|nr:hypothetical protein [Paraflavitalea speifideiaquila]
MYHYEVRDIHLNSGEKKLGIHRFIIDPQLPEQRFLQQFKYANDRFDVDLQEIGLANLNIPLLLQGQVEAYALVSGKSSIRIYRDLSYPHDKRTGSARTHSRLL